MKYKVGSRVMRTDYCCSDEYPAGLMGHVVAVRWDLVGVEWDGRSCTCANYDADTRALALVVGPHHVESPVADTIPAPPPEMPPTCEGCDALRHSLDNYTVSTNSLIAELRGTYDRNCAVISDQRAQILYLEKELARLKRK